jgi:hypothetical protein
MYKLFQFNCNDKFWYVVRVLEDGNYQILSYFNTEEEAQQYEKNLM